MVAFTDSSKLALTADELANATSVCRKTIYNHTAPRGTLQSVKIGSAVRYSLAEINRWIAELQAKTTQSSG